MKILIIEDDVTIRALLEMALFGAGYKDVQSVARGDDGLMAVRHDRPDLVLLDLMLPGLDGFTIAKRIREMFVTTKIIMLTARTESDDIVRGLECGADDYVTKPFDRKVLLARIKAVSRRGLPLIDSVEFDGLRIDEPSRSVSLNGEKVELSAGEFELLIKLIAHRGRIFARPADERTVDVQVASIRKKLGEWAKHIETVRGVGYRVSE